MTDPEVKVIKLVKSPTTSIGIQIVESHYCDKDTVYFMPEEYLCLEDARKEAIDRVREIEKRYKYLERAMVWILKNTRIEK